jgi:hypothetical protein
MGEVPGGGAAADQRPIDLGLLVQAEFPEESANMCLLHLATEGIREGFDNPGSQAISKPTSHFMILQKKAEAALLAQEGVPTKNAIANLKDALDVRILYGCSGDRPARLQLVAKTISNGDTDVFDRDAEAGDPGPIEAKLHAMLDEREDIKNYDQRNRSDNKTVRQQTIRRMKNILGLVLVWLAAIENALKGEKRKGKVEENNAKRVLSRWYIYFAHDWASIETGEMMPTVEFLGLSETAGTATPTPKKGRFEDGPGEGDDGLGAAVLPEMPPLPEEAEMDYTGILPRVSTPP